MRHNGLLHIVHVEVRMEVTEAMDELQRLLVGGSAVGLEHGRHEER